MLPIRPPFYFSVDVETAGPTPGEYALLSIGACTLDDPQQTFYVELQPDRPGQITDACAVHGLSLEDLSVNGTGSETAMRQFESWVKQVTPGGARPIFVAFNAPFDWMFVAEYFQRYIDRNPFGHSALDIKALFMGLYQTSWRDTSYTAVCRTLHLDQPLAHNALQDALAQANVFRKLLEKLAQTELVNLK